MLLPFFNTATSLPSIRCSASRCKSLHNSAPVVCRASKCTPLGKSQVIGMLQMPCRECCEMVVSEGSRPQKESCYLSMWFAKQAEKCLLSCCSSLKAVSSLKPSPLQSLSIACHEPGPQLLVGTAHGGYRQQYQSASSAAALRLITA